jgi:hypothetical protein
MMSPRPAETAFREKSTANLAGETPMPCSTSTNAASRLQALCLRAVLPLRHVGCCVAGTTSTGAAMKKQRERPGRGSRQAAYSALQNARKGKSALHGRPTMPSMRQDLVPESPDEAVYEQRKEAS